MGRENIRLLFEVPYDIAHMLPFPRKLMLFVMTTNEMLARNICKKSLLDTDKLLFLI